MKIFKILVLFLTSFFVSCKQYTYTGNEVDELNTRLVNGWNTWNSSSVLSHVLLPECFVIKLHFCTRAGRR